MNGVLLINKEADMTSHDVVAITRKSLGLKKVGHSGTLDPQATGLMLIMLGQATKCANFLLSERKTYRAKLLLGLSSDTYDYWGKIIATKTPQKHKEAEIITVLDSFLGKSKQIPPIYSAIKVGGKKLYQYARSDLSVSLSERDIEIYSIVLNSYQEDTIDFTVECSSGTYLRSLCVDIAARLQEIGLMSSLVRLAIGKQQLEDADSIADLQKAKVRIHPLSEILADFPQIDYPNKADIINGRKIRLTSKYDELLIYNNQELLAYYIREKDDIYVCKRGLW